MYIDKTAVVEKNVSIGENSKIWHYAHIRENAKIGRNCIIGKNCYIDHNVRIGSNVKIQNNCSIYYMTIIEDGAFIGPNVVITNDKKPRAVDTKGKLKTSRQWKAEKTAIRRGASIGAGSVLLSGLTIGQYAMVGAGSVVTNNVSDFALVYGNPAKLNGYVCKCGDRITKIEEKGNKLILYCKKCKEKIQTVKNDTYS